MSPRRAESRKVVTFRFGEPVQARDVLRILATRYVPRGVRKEHWPQHFDVWLPLLAPSADLLRWYQGQKTRESKWKDFASRYRREMARNKAAVQMIELLAVLATRLPIAVGCFCAEEQWCHRSLLREWIRNGSVRDRP